MSVKWKNGVVRKGEVWYNDSWHSSELSFQIQRGYTSFALLSVKLTGKGIVITCGIEGLHSKNSLHPKGDAVDIRIWYYTESECEMLVEKGKEHLGKDYDIILEKDHIHLEWDPK